MYSLGLSAGIARGITEDTFRNYQANGIELMEVSVSYLDHCNMLEFDKYAKWAKEYGVKLWSFHLPFAEFTQLDISSRELCDFSVEASAELMKKAADIGIDKFVIHPSAEPIEDDDRPARMECAKESLDKLARIAKTLGGVVAVEDIPRSCLGKNSQEILELISVNDDLRVCFDTNHLLSEDPADFIHNVGNKIITTHVSDYDFINERHWLPGEGKNDWKAILQAFRDIDYKGAWLYEIAFTAPWSIVRDRDLTYADFARNAEELFSGKPLTKVGIAKENIGMWEN